MRANLILFTLIGIHELVEEDPSLCLEEHHAPACLVCSAPDNCSEEGSDSIRSSNSSYELFGKIRLVQSSHTFLIIRHLWYYDIIA